MALYSVGVACNVIGQSVQVVVVTSVHGLALLQVRVQ